jgi:YD repeat-containing protein
MNIETTKARPTTMSSTRLRSSRPRPAAAAARPWSHTYTYDAVGNRETLVTGAGTTQYAYDAADRLTSVTPPGAGAISYTWDDNGNLEARGSDSFD